LGSPRRTTPGITRRDERVFLPKPYTPQQVQMMLLMLASKAG
jgi:hypothetical protein